MVSRENAEFSPPQAPITCFANKLPLSLKTQMINQSCKKKTAPWLFSSRNGLACTFLSLVNPAVGGDCLSLDVSMFRHPCTTVPLPVTEPPLALILPLHERVHGSHFSKVSHQVLFHYWICWLYVFKMPRVVFLAPLPQAPTQRAPLAPRPQKNTPFSRSRLKK